ncbi:MAG: permease-like cell division protein FtsX [Thermoleophilia bacterium]|jgi:cell division transport system permease protein
MGRIRFFLKEAFGSLRRNYFMTIAALVTVFLSIVVLGGVLVFVYTTDAVLSEVESKVEITVYLKTDPDPSATEIEAMQSEIMNWIEVESSTFVSKSEALDRMKKNFADSPEVMQNLTGNPFPASFEIALKNPQMVKTVAARFDGNPIVDQVSYGEEIADKLFKLTSQTRNVLLGFIALLGIVAILLISNTIRLSIFARRREVEIMKLVGATNWFIRWPFVLEGVVVGFLGAAVATVVVLVANSILVGKVRGSMPFMAVPLDAVPYLLVTAILLGVGVVIGALGSGIGLRRFLKI